MMYMWKSTISMSHSHTHKHTFGYIYYTKQTLRFPFEFNIHYIYIDGYTNNLPVARQVTFQWALRRSFQCIRREFELRMAGSRARGEGRETRSLPSV